jgi:hypothetical protein
MPAFRYNIKFYPVNLLARLSQVVLGTGQQYAALNEKTAWTNRAVCGFQLSYSGLLFNNCLICSGRLLISYHYCLIKSGSKLVLSTCCQILSCISSTVPVYCQAESDSSSTAPTYCLAESGSISTAPAYCLTKPGRLLINSSFLSDLPGQKADPIRLLPDRLRQCTSN